MGYFGPPKTVEPSVDKLNKDILIVFFDRLNPYFCIHFKKYRIASTLSVILKSKINLSRCMVRTGQCFNQMLLAKKLYQGTIFALKIVSLPKNYVKKHYVMKMLRCKSYLLVQILCFCTNIVF